MGKIIKSITKNTCKQNPHFVARPEYDYGTTHFFEYKDTIFIYVHRCNNTGTTTVRADLFQYLIDNYGTNERELVERHPEVMELVNKFQNVSCFDLDELEVALDELIRICDEFGKEINSVAVDRDIIIAAIENEKAFLTGVLDTAKADTKWWALSDYEMRSLKSNFKQIAHHVEYLDRISFDIVNGLASKRDLRNWEKHVLESGWISARSAYGIMYQVNELNNYVELSNEQNEKER